MSHTTKSAGFTDLPNEILVSILCGVRTCDLFNCRLVSKLWKEIVTPLCRQRYVEVYFDFWMRPQWSQEDEEKEEDDYKFSNFSTLCNIFANVDDLVWSSCQLRLWKDPVMEDGLSKADTEEFVRTFGQKIRKVKIRGDDTSGLVQLLSRLPNIEELDFGTGNEVCYTPMDPDQIPSSAGFKLLKLKRIFMHMSNWIEIEFLGYLFGSVGVSLNSIYVNVQGDEDSEFVQYHPEETEKLATLLATVPSITIKFHFFQIGTKMMRIFEPRNLQITELQFPFYDYHPQIAQPFPICEAFFENISKRLQKLKIERLFSYTGPADPILLPSFPVLRHLDLEMEANPATPFRNPLARFSANQFPVLETMQIKNCGINVHPFVFSIPFISVKQLVLGTSGRNRIVKKPLRFWDKAFPNITSLDLCQVNGSDVLYILSNMTHLVHLSIHFDKEMDEADDMNEVWSGIWDTDLHFRKSNEEILEYRTQHPRPSLLSMTGLKTLKLFDGVLRDSGIHLSLLQMQPLERLELTRIENISKEYRMKLQAFHREFEFSKY